LTIQKLFGTTEKAMTKQAIILREIFMIKFCRKFWANILFVRNLILPEAEFADVLTKNRKFDNQQINFYLVGRYS
jgi:hypothetical protein